MARASPIQTNFTAGELSPRLEGRTDLDKYANGAKTLENMIVLPHGPATKRGGTQYIGNTKVPTGKVRLVRFEFSKTQAYVLEFGEYYIRIFTAQAPLIGGPFSAEFSTEFDRTTRVEVTTTYTEAELFELQFSQSADVLYIAHSSHPPQTLSRVGPVTWSLDLFQTTSGPYLSLNLDNALTITPSGTTGAITLTASSALFYAGHVGALWRYGTGDGYVIITGYTSALVVNATVVTTLSGTGASSDWSEGAWSDVRGYPGAVTFFEQRIVWAGSTYEPQTIWMSVSADYTNFLLSGAVVADADALIYTIASNQVNAIQWVSSGDVLAIGTAGGIHVASGSSRDTALTATNARFVQRTRYGCQQIEPITIANVAIFIQRGGEKARQLEYQFETDSYSTPDVTILSEHITRGGLVQMAYQQDPDSIIWAVRNDGRLIGMTFERDQNVFAWHRHTVGGVSDAAGTHAIVESVAIIPGSFDTVFDEVWLSVKRWVNGAAVRHIEIISAGHKPDGLIEDAFFVDCGLTYSGVAATTLTGLDHLEGETLSVLSDGATHPDVVVTGGAVTLNLPTTKAHIGYGYNADIGTLGIEAGSDTGQGQGKTKRISKVTLRIFQSVGALIGHNSATLDRIPFRDSSLPMNEAVPLFTGDVSIPFNAGYATQAEMFIRQDQPLPLTVLAIMPEVKTNG